MTGYEIQYGPEVAEALHTGAPIVALESTIISHGLPRPDNITIAREIEQIVRDNGAVPATIGMVDGQLFVGLDDKQLERLASRTDVVKLSVRDLAAAAVTGVDGATTVASTSAVAAAAGIRVFATGGLGGVHRLASDTFDESADLITLARTPICVVSAGVKSILDVGATLERLETLGVGILGYGTRQFPGFYLNDSGFGLDWSVDTPEDIARVLRARRQQDASGAAIVVANPLPVEEQLDPALHDQVLSDALHEMKTQGVVGKQVTPFLLAYFHEHTQGASLDVNIKIILRNSELAARIAVASRRVDPKALAGSVIRRTTPDSTTAR